MKILYFVIILTLIFLMRIENRNNEEVLGSKYFYMSNGKSKEMYTQMKNDGVSEDTLKHFVYMEDMLLKLEFLSVCSRTSRIQEATSLSQSIQDRFPAYDFRYHQEHLKQTSNPNKRINSKIICP
jgi:hypothetical protein